MGDSAQSTPFKKVSRQDSIRNLKDVLARYGVAIGGVSVIIAIVLIFFYLFYVVFPLLKPADSALRGQYAIPGGAGNTLHLAVEEQGELAARYMKDGQLIFFDVRSGEVRETRQLVKEGAVTSSAQGNLDGFNALGMDNGQAYLVKHSYRVSYPNDRRTLTPRLEYPYGEDGLVLDEDGRAINQLAVRDGEERLLFATGLADGTLQLVSFNKESSFLDEDEVTLTREVTTLDHYDLNVDYLLLDPDQRWLYVAGRSGELLQYDLRDIEEPVLTSRVRLTQRNIELTSLEFLVGGISLLAGGSDGKITQWFSFRDENNDYKLTRIRGFEEQRSPILDITTEHRRKGFIAADAQGNFAIYHTTAQRLVLDQTASDKRLLTLAISPRSDTLLAEDEQGQAYHWHIDNEHPEVSWHALWEKVHYEGYAEPQHIWQSSSASNDFEPKMSLTPLSFGTLKAAFYAMIFAVPLAIMGAIFTAYFMAPRMRQVVKPTIEIMEALPTVILGFLAGLWLAPAIELHLPGIFSLLLFLPIGVLLFAYAWTHAPYALRRWVPEGWEAALLVPVIILITWFGLAMSLPLEQLLFDGDMRGWLVNDLGIGFDQRNSLVVGLAMGFAVIPTIFSIAEDALFSVPKHLTFGSLALGASRWQTLYRVVILTASPGIFSAVMIGLGRAVGETMIVLMATGNTPVMDFSIFQGMRTLSANIAVEMPESEVDSTHYRVLFLAALVLFMFTFFFNTVAEIVRQRLRKKYSSL